MKLTPAERGRWKFRLGSLGVGVLAAGAVFGASLAVSDDLRLMYLVGAIMLFCGATWIGAKSWRDWLSACLLYLPLGACLAFSFWVSCRFYGRICCYGPSRLRSDCLCWLPG